jgi:hypothetical protein
MQFFFLTARALGLLLVPAVSLMSASLLEFQSGATQTGLLELYTSEGCSSCPPAEAWLSRLKQNPNLWKDFVPVAFHVDYWDYLGWKDPFASQAHTQRQHDYAALWRSRSVYTPGFVLDGREWREWSNRDEFLRPSTKAVGVLTARTEDGGQWKLHFKPAAGSASPSCDFHAALLGFDLTSDVKAGENRGRKLEHDFVVLALANTAGAKIDGAAQATIALSPTLASVPKRFGFAAWVTMSKSLQPLQAVGGWLSLTNRAP